MKSRRRSKFLRMDTPPEPVEAPSDRTENEETRRKARDFLRDRGEEDSMWFEDDSERPAV